MDGETCERCSYFPSIESNNHRVLSGCADSHLGCHYGVFLDALVRISDIAVVYYLDALVRISDITMVYYLDALVSHPDCSN